MSERDEVTTKRYGAVIVFTSDATRATAQHLLRKLERDGVIEPAQLRDFDPADGWPVWYVP